VKTPLVLARLEGGVGSNAAESEQGNFTYHGRSKVLLLLPCHCFAVWLLNNILRSRSLERYGVGLQAIRRLARAELSCCAAHDVRLRRSVPDGKVQGGERKRGGGRERNEYCGWYNLYPQGYHQRLCLIK
jgi:hypothetical protein